MKKAEDPHLAMLEYLTTPLADVGLSPSQLLNSRRLRSRVPIATSLLLPQSHPSVLKALQKKQHTQKMYHDRTALKKPSADLRPDETVRMYSRGQWQPVKVTEKLPNSSYVVATPSGAKYRRTRSDLKKTCEKPFKPVPPPDFMEEFPVFNPQNTPAEAPKSPKVAQSPPKVVTTRYGRSVNKPQRLDL